MVVLSPILFPAFVLAAGYGTDETRKAAGLPDKLLGSSSFPELVGALVSVLLGFLGIVFFLLILYAGFNWMTAQGNSDKIDKSKDTIQSAALGLIVILAAYAITNFVFTELNVGGTSSDTSSTTTP